MLMLLRRKRSDSICCLYRRCFIGESLLKPQPDDRWPQAGPGWALHCVCASVCVISRAQTIYEADDDDLYFD